MKLSPYIKSIDQTGLVIIKFDMEMQVQATQVLND